MSKRIISALLSGGIIVSAMLTSSCAPGAASSEPENDAVTIVYVSADADSVGASGKINSPFSTIEEARDYLRTKNIGKNNHGIIYLRAGSYHIADSIAFTAEDSYVTLAAYGQENVEIKGSVQLEQNKFKKLNEVSGDRYSSKSRLPADVVDKIYVYDLKADGIPAGSINKNGFNWTKQPLQPELVADGKLQTLAGYPDNGSYITSSNLSVLNGGGVPRDCFFDKSDSAKTYDEMLAMDGPVFFIANLPDTAHTWAGAYDEESSYSCVNGNMPENNPLCDNTKYETDSWLSGYFANEYGSDSIRMYSIKSRYEKYYIYCKYPSMYGVNNSLKVTAVNLLCELNAEGEYYIDRYGGNDILYYYPEVGTTEGKEITLNTLDKPLITIEGATEFEINGISLTGTTNSGITMTDCESCVISDCELYNISMDAIRIGDNNGLITADSGYKTFGGGRNNIVVNCTVHDMGHGGVYLSGGDIKSLERGDNVVKNCEFYNISRLETYTPAVYLEGVGNTAQDNYIHDAPHMVIQIMGNDMLVTRNKIINTCYNANDMAPIYIGRNLVWLGNEISFNYIENVRYSSSTDFDFGIYMDDNAAGAIIRNNIFSKIGGNAVYVNKGYGHYIVDNIVVDGTGPYCRYLTNGFHGWARPMPNEKSLRYRFYDMLRTEKEASASGDLDKESASSYWNTKENIKKWVKHYNDLYNSLPEFSKNRRYAFDLGKKYFPDDGDSGSDTWTNQDSAAAQANMTIVRNITVNTGDLWHIGGFYDDVNPSDADTFDAKRHRAASAEDLGLDLKTGKISESSSLASDENYGSEWISEWNLRYDISGAGLRLTDKQQLWLMISEAESSGMSSPELEKLLAQCRKTAADGLASQLEIDEKCSLLAGRFPNNPTGIDN